MALTTLAYQGPLEEALISALLAYRPEPRDFDVRGYEDELETEEGIKRLVGTLLDKPAVLVNVLTPENVQNDASQRANDELQAVEVVVCASDTQSMRRQKNTALNVAYHVRKAVQGARFGFDLTNEAPLVFDNIEGVLSVKGLCVYVVNFHLDYSIALDE